MSLREMLSDYWYAFQQELFPRLESEVGPMGERYELFVAVLKLVRVEALLPYFRGQVGRPEEDRAALARAFIAKAVGCESRMALIAGASFIEFRQRWR